MDPRAVHGASLRFGVFELDLCSRELRRQGSRIRLQEQPFQVLRVLVEHAGELVTRETLRHQLWSSHIFVDFEHGLNNAIARLREALGDSAGIPRYIETLPRLGYRFIYPLTVDPDESRPGPSGGRAELVPSLALVPATVVTPALMARGDPPAAVTRSRRTAAWLLLAASTLTLAAISVVRYWPSDGTADAGGIHSIVVLPFENLSPDSSQEYFVDGISDALISNLAQLDSFRVVSRTTAMHYKGNRQPLAQIARELQVDAVVEGSVMRAGPRVRVNVQLIRGVDDRHLWAQSYERDEIEVIALQNDLARAIAEAIAAHVAPKPAYASWTSP
jgi:TolB-like protein/DNA-binding winged helix-turn-helix (wHTH) protein